MLWQNWLKRQILNYKRHQVNKFFKKIESRGGIVGNKAVLLVYDSEKPELSYILTENI